MLRQYSQIEFMISTFQWYSLTAHTCFYEQSHYFHGQNSIGFHFFQLQSTVTNSTLDRRKGKSEKRLFEKVKRRNSTEFDICSLSQNSVSKFRSVENKHFVVYSLFSSSNATSQQTNFIRKINLLHSRE